MEIMSKGKIVARFVAKRRSRIVLVFCGTKERCRIGVVGVWDWIGTSWPRWAPSPHQALKVGAGEKTWIGTGPPDDGEQEPQVPVTPSFHLCPPGPVSMRCPFRLTAGSSTGGPQ